MAKFLVIFFTILSLCLSAFSQTQYDYYDISAVNGGVDKALNGTLIIVGLVIIGIVLLFTIAGVLELYYFINPSANPEYRKKKEDAIKAQQHQAYVEKMRRNAFPEAIDLGLSVRWASFNLGAYKSSDPGGVFYWGDNGSSASGWAKYHTTDVNKIGDIAGNIDFDVVSNILGIDWRLPTAKECEELIQNCKWELTIIDNIEGYKIIGPNENYIFLPYNKINNVLNKLTSGHYWTSSPSFNPRNSDSSKNLCFGEYCKEHAEIHVATARACKFGIRPVYDVNHIPKNRLENHVKEQYSQLKTIEDLDIERKYQQYDELSNVDEEEVTMQLIYSKCYNPELTYTDEYGVVYSIDGKRLIDGTKCAIDNYIIREGTEIICKDAFIHVKCKNLTLPGSIVYIGSGRFTLPQNGKIVSNSENYSIINNLLIDNRKKSIVVCLDKYIEDVIICEPIVEIGENSFIECYALKKVKLPNTIVKIGARAFDSCENLVELNLPSSVLKIEGAAFYDCKSLSISNIPDNIVSIGDAAFAHCVIDNLVIPNTLVELGNNPFSCNCNNAISNSENFIIENGVLIDYKSKAIIQLLSTANTVNIPAWATCIRSFAFSNSLIESVTIPENIKDVEDGIFCGCKNLKEVILLSKLNSIPNSMFRSCSNLIEINLPDTIKSIETEAFYNCKNLQKVNMANGIRTIKKAAFAYCENLKSFEFIPSLEDIELCLENCSSLLTVVFNACKAKTVKLPSEIMNLVIGNDVEILPSNLFAGNKNIQSITIPENVRRISKGCFSDCSLQRIVFKTIDITFDSNWLYNCKNISEIYVPAEIYNQVIDVIPSGIKIKKIYHHRFLFIRW